MSTVRVIDDTDTRHGVYDLIRDIDEDVKDVKSNIYNFRRDTTGRLSNLESEVSTLKQDNRAINLQISDMRGDIKALSSHVDSIEKQIEKQFDGINRRIDDMNQSQMKWFSLLGLLVAIVPIVLSIISSFIK